jgi:Fur family ferric uptake transcriptional regulator
VREPAKKRSTRQRQIILEAIQDLKAHPSADELWAIVRQKLPRISLGTVYRNLEVLTDMGHIQKLELGGTVKRFDWNPQRHYHIRCLQCNRVDDAPLAPLNQIENDLYGSTVYEIIGHRLEFIGLCPHCSRGMHMTDQDTPSADLSQSRTSGVRE